MPVIQLEVWGRYACFSRPELHVERFSYDVPTLPLREEWWKRFFITLA